MLSRGMEVHSKTVMRYLELLEDLMLVRRLQPYLTNHGKRLVKAPRVYIRDTAAYTRSGCTTSAAPYGQAWR